MNRQQRRWAHARSKQCWTIAGVVLWMAFGLGLTLYLVFA